MRSQNATSKDDLQMGGNRYMPFAFTEQGVAMLSGILHSDIAIEVNIKIMRAFTAMRRFMLNNAHLFQRMESIEIKQLHTDEKVDSILNRLNAGEPPSEGVFFDGQIFDAYQFVCDLIGRAKQRIILIDNYVDQTVLSLLDKRAVGVTAQIYTQNPSSLKVDLKRHNAQYPPIDVAEAQGIHDRFLIIDKKVYHIGASIKDLGKKLFAFSKMELEPDVILGRVGKRAQ